MKGHEKCKTKPNEAQKWMASGKSDGKNCMWTDRNKNVGDTKTNCLQIYSHLYTYIRVYVYVCVS